MCAGQLVSFVNVTVDQLCERQSQCDGVESIHNILSVRLANAII